MLLPLETGKDNKILRAVSKPVKKINKKTLKFIKGMEKTMRDAKGVGLAAPQVGVNDRIFIALLDNKSIIPMINPEIIDFNDELEYGEEGCLSHPGVWGEVPRHTKLMVSYLDAKGEKRKLKLEGFNARIIQHEMDHLNAKMIVDYFDEEGSASNVAVVK